MRRGALTHFAACLPDLERPASRSTLVPCCPPRLPAVTGEAGDAIGGS